MRIVAALQGNLENEMKAEFKAATEGVVRGINRAGEETKTALREQLRNAGMSKLEKTWRSKFYENGRIDAAAAVWSKAPKITKAFDVGMTIRAKNGVYLAIPTFKRKHGRNRVSPKNWPSAWGKLLFIPGRNGKNPLLVTVKKYKSGRQKITVQFILIKQVKVRKRININRVRLQMRKRLPEIIKQEYDKAADAMQVRERSFSGTK